MKISAQLGAEKLVFAIDSRAGHVAIEGWQELTSITAAEMIRALEPFCSAFLYTHIDTEGLLQGLPSTSSANSARKPRASSSPQAASGSQQEIEALDDLGIDAVVGMAIYQGLIPA